MPSSRRRALTSGCSSCCARSPAAGICRPRPTVRAARSSGGCWRRSRPNIRRGRGARAMPRTCVPWRSPCRAVTLSPATRSWPTWSGGRAWICATAASCSRVDGRTSHACGPAWRPWLSGRRRDRIGIRRLSARPLGALSRRSAALYCPVRPAACPNARACPWEEPLPREGAAVFENSTACAHHGRTPADVCVQSSLI